MKEYLRTKITSALRALSYPDQPEPKLEKPRVAAHGDLTTNIAMVIAGSLGASPRMIAQTIIDKLETDPSIIGKIEIAGPGFINFFFSDQYIKNRLHAIIVAGSEFGRSNVGNGLKTQVEFVSANPTGPLTVGHGRGAVCGDTIARLLEWTGYEVTREYYFNNAGRQMRILGDSVRLRYLEILEEKTFFPEDYYQGEYIREIAQHLFQEYGDKLKTEPAEGVFKQTAEEEIFEDIRKSLERLGVHHDIFFNENSLYENGQVEDVIRILREKNLAYDMDGAVWFRATAFKAEKDKVIVKNTGEPTYRLPDIANHKNKIERGFKFIIDVLGADHVATYPDVLAGIKALGYDESIVKVLIHQFVTIMQGGEAVKMSTRKANFITLDELMDEVGPDVVRYFFLMRSMGSHLNFDLSLAREQSEENPVYYLQYAYARIAGIIRHAESHGVDLKRIYDLSVLKAPEELSLNKILSEFPDIVESCSATYEPHRLAEYLHDVAGSFHKFYHEHRVVTEKEEMTGARITLCRAVKIVLANGFSILGISTPERM